MYARLNSNVYHHNHMNILKANQAIKTAAIRSKYDGLVGLGTSFFVLLYSLSALDECVIESLACRLQSRFAMAWARAPIK
jgi:hypothetical protein